MTDASPSAHPRPHWFIRGLNSPFSLATVAAVVLSVVQHWIFAPIDRAAESQTAHFQEFRAESSEFETLIAELGVRVNDQASKGNFEKIEIGDLRDKLFDNMSKQEGILSSIVLWADAPIKGDIESYRKSLAGLHDVIAVLHDHNDMKAVANDAGTAVLQKRAIEAKLNKQLY